MQPEELHAIFRANLRARREELGLTQAQLGEATGLNQVHISMLEKGARNANLATLAKLAEALDTTPSVMLSKKFPKIRDQVAIPA